jgi:tetratricopeptide (TPR) repeat protein
MVANLMNNRIPPPQASFLEKLDLNLTPLELKSKYPSDRQLNYRRQYLAVIKWFRRLYPHISKISAVESIQGYIESFYHLIVIKDWDRALLILIEPLNLYSDLEDQDLLGQLQLWNEYIRIIELCEKVLSKLDRCHQLPLINRIAGAYERLGDYEQARKSYFLALSLSQELGQSKIVAQSLCGLGNIYLLERKYDDATRFYNDSWELAQEIGHDPLKLTIVGNLGNLFVSIGDYVNAIEYFKQAIQITQQIGDTYGEAVGSLGVGASYSNLGQHQLAEKYLMDALATYQDFGDQQGELSVLVNLGNNYSFQKNYSTAIEYYQEAVEIAVKIKDHVNEFNAITGLGSIYYALADYHQAMHYFQISQVIADRLNHSFYVAIAMTNIGSNAAKLDQIDLAIDYLRKGLDLLKQLCAFDLAARAAYQLADVYKHNQQFDLARTYLIIATTIAQDLSLPLLVECESLRLFLAQEHP